MEKPENYTDQEWELVTSLPSLVGSAMAGVGKSGIVGTSKEMFSSVQTMMRARKNFSQNSFVGKVMPSTTDPKLAMQEAKQTRNAVIARVKNADIQQRNDLSKMVLEDFSKAIQIVKEKQTAEEAQTYKNWVISIAEDVANAAKEGDFLGFGGERISENEQNLLNEMRSQLG